VGMLKITALHSNDTRIIAHKCKFTNKQHNYNTELNYQSNIDNDE